MLSWVRTNWLHPQNTHNSSSSSSLSRNGTGSVRVLLSVYMYHLYQHVLHGNNILEWELIDYTCRIPTIPPPLPPPCLRMQVLGQLEYFCQYHLYQHVLIGDSIPEWRNFTTPTEYPQFPSLPGLIMVACRGPFLSLTTCINILPVMPLHWGAGTPEFALFYDTFAGVHSRHHSQQQSS